MTTKTQDNDFGSKFLEDILAWAGSQLDPTDVFSENFLLDWAMGKPVEDVATESKLEQWALDNGFIRDPEQA